MARMTIEELVRQLALVHGAGLRCVALYGSAVRGEQLARKPNLNVLVLVDAIDMAHLRAEAAVARAWSEAGHPPPLTLTLEEWQGSADTFPMEYADILAHHRVLHGALPTERPAVRREDLRLQLEHEVRSKLLRLRHAVLSSGADPKSLASVIEGSLPAIMALVRAAVRLGGEEPPADSATTLERYAAVTRLPATPFQRVLGHGRGSAPVSGDDAVALMSEYLDAVARMARWVDGQR